MSEPVRLLLVDDEKALLGLLKRHLERVGYSVVACLSAELAVEALADPAWQPDILVADETLPGETGTALAITLLGRDPRLMALLCSGYPLSIEALPEPLRARVAILQKPYMPAMLEQAIEELAAGQTPRDSGASAS